MTIAAIVQARSSSERLPGKVTREVAGKPMLEYVLDRLRTCARLDEVAVATSADDADDVVDELCDRLGVPCLRGPLDDVAGRYLHAAGGLGCDAFVRISGDSPLMDPAIVDHAVGLFLEQRPDLVTNVATRTFPKGESVEVIDAAALARAHARMTTAHEREHVTPYFYEHSDEFRIVPFESGHDWGSIQLSVDTPEDLERFEAIVARMTESHHTYGLDEVLGLLADIEGEAR